MLVVEMTSHEVIITLIESCSPTKRVKMLKQVRVHVFPDLYRLTHRQSPVYFVHIDRV